MLHDTPAFALLLGLGSAISLPIGAAIGLAARPRAMATSVLMAFGAGALLFALTIEIVAHSYHIAGYVPLAIGCVAGGLLFELLNQVINRRGGFLRKGATLLYQVTRSKRLRAADVVDHLARVDVFRALPPDEIAKLVPHIDLLEFPKGAEVCAEGDPCDEIYLIDKGSVRVTREDGAVVVSTLGAGTVFGEMELISGSPYVATVVVASDDTALYRLRRADFERVLAASPATQLIVSTLARARLEAASPARAYKSLSENRWRRSTIRHLTAGDLAPTRAEVQAVASEHAHGGAVLGIWLGILLDGIPESLVIGLSLLGATQTPWGLVAGVFLANLPEAMSSSVVMRQQSFSVARILGLWSAVVVVTAAGAAFGNAALRGLDPEVFAVIEGCAAGAMLTSIAETMLPEAYHQGGWVVGLSTLAGFLAALGIKAATGG
ncbi:MAG TPA: cyclic nucleotide-binding domain-containing protein [Nannocystaceae bacterium]|nr:cyclic nucleotide-binding domain-containing protein [Nannocystaceae bacterium]